MTVVRGGFGSRANDTIRCMVRFGDYLYAGTGHDGAELYRSLNGISWELVDVNPKFTSTEVIDPKTNGKIINNIMIAGGGQSNELRIFNHNFKPVVNITDVSRAIFTCDISHHSDSILFAGGDGVIRVCKVIIYN